MILDVELSLGAGHLYSTSWCTQFYLQLHICTIIVYICVYIKLNKEISKYNLYYTAECLAKNQVWWYSKIDFAISKTDLFLKKLNPSALYPHKKNTFPWNNFFTVVQKVSLLIVGLPDTKRGCLFIDISNIKN